MKQEEGGEDKRAGNDANCQKENGRKSTALQLHKAICDNWQIWSRLPEVDEMLQIIVMESREQAA